MTGAFPVRIDIGYHGEQFYGSQRQPGVRTVQEELESAIEQVTGSRTRLTLAGRTDRGVHAVGQVASGAVTWSRDLERLRYSIDSVTGRDLVVKRVARVDTRFHARFSATRREYRYRIYSSERSPVLIRDTVWWTRSTIDVDLLNAASQSLIGEHDFRSFAGRGVGSGETFESTVRNLEVADWRIVPECMEPDGGLIEFRIVANAFLPHMVRNIVGALIEVGSGSQDSGWFIKLVDQLDRRKAPPPAPPHGLVLWRVDYDGIESHETSGLSASLEQE